MCKRQLLWIIVINTLYYSAKIIYKENKYYFDLLRTNFIKKSDKVGGHEKGGQIWNRATMEGANMGVLLYMLVMYVV